LLVNVLSRRDLGEWRPSYNALRTPGTHYSLPKYISQVTGGSARNSPVTNIFWCLMNHRSNSVETILMELEAGIIPTSMFRHKLACGVDPFDGMDLKEARKLKRKWRKLKRKHNVQKLKLFHANSEIRFHLRNDREKK